MMADVSVVVFSDCFGGVAAFVSVFCPPWDFAFWKACEVMGCDDPEAGDGHVVLPGVVEVESVGNLEWSHLGDRVVTHSSLPVDVADCVLEGVLIETDDADSSAGVFTGERDFLVDDVEGIKNRSVGVHGFVSLLVSGGVRNTEPECKITGTHLGDGNHRQKSNPPEVGAVGSKVKHCAVQVKDVHHLFGVATVEIRTELLVHFCLLMI